MKSLKLSLKKKKKTTTEKNKYITFNNFFSFNDNNKSIL